MSAISKMETPTDWQEETAILLEEYEKRIATLQESLRQAGRLHPNEAVILQEIKRVVEERDDLRRRLENAELLIERLKDEIYSLRGLIDNATDKQPGGITKLDKALQNIDVTKRVLVENSCPSEFGLKDCKCRDSCCEDCWNEEVGE